MDVVSSDKKNATHRALLDAARDLVFERGHERISVQDVTSRANVATGTYYNYFECKTDIFEAVAEAMRQEISACLEETRSRIQDPAMRLAVTLKFYFIQSMDNADWRTFTSNAGMDHLTLQQDPAQLQEDLERGVQGGRFKLDDVHFTQALISGMVRNVNQSIARGKASRSAIDYAVRSVLQMLGLPEMVTRALIQTAMPPMAAGKRLEKSAAVDTAAVGTAAVDTAAAGTATVVTSLSDYTSVKTV